MARADPSPMQFASQTSGTFYNPTPSFKASDMEINDITLKNHPFATKKRQQKTFLYLVLINSSVTNSTHAKTIRSIHLKR